jgi:hypothetical protein
MHEAVSRRPWSLWQQGFVVRLESMCMSSGSWWMHHRPGSGGARLPIKIEPTPVMVNDGGGLCIISLSKASLMQFCQLARATLGKP